MEQLIKTLQADVKALYDFYKGISKDLELVRKFVDIIKDKVDRIDKFIEQIDCEESSDSEEHELPTAKKQKK